MIDLDELSEDEVEAVINTRGFQKMLAYRRLADGIEVLEDEDELMESMVNSITKQHSQVRSEESTREFFRLFRDEVSTWTESLSEEEEETQSDASELRDLVVDDGGEST